jgi:hypothetical protein
MNKTVVAVVAILACAAVAVGYFLFGRERYVTVNAGNGKMYKVDRVTGETGFIRGTTETPVSAQPPDPPPEPRVIYVPQEVVKEVVRWIPDPTNITVKEVLPAGISREDVDFAGEIKRSGISRQDVDFAGEIKRSGINRDDRYFIAYLKKLLATPNVNVDYFDIALESYVESARKGGSFNTLLNAGVEERNSSVQPMNHREVLKLYLSRP